jgi:hypothetical protein
LYKIAWFFQWLWVILNIYAIENQFILWMKNGNLSGCDFWNPSGKLKLSSRRYKLETFHHNLCQIWIFYHQMCILFFFMWKLSLVLNSLVTSMFTDNYSVKYLRAVVLVIVWYLDLQLPMQSVPTTTKIVSLNPAHGKVYPIQYYVIKFVSDLRQINGLLRVLWFPPPIKLTASI